MADKPAVLLNKLNSLSQLCSINIHTVQVSSTLDEMLTRLVKMGSLKD